MISTIDSVVGASPALSPDTPAQFLEGVAAASAEQVRPTQPAINSILDQPTNELAVSRQNLVTEPILQQSGHVAGAAANATTVVSTQNRTAAPASTEIDAVMLLKDAAGNVSNRPATSADVAATDKSTAVHAINAARANITAPQGNAITTTASIAASAESTSALPDTAETLALTGTPSPADADASSSQFDLSASGITGQRSGSQETTVRTTPELTQRITQQIADTIVTRAATTQVGETLTLDAILDPPDLGRLHFRITRSESGLTAVVAAEKGDVQHVIAEQTAFIERSVRVHLNGGESMQFSASDTPFFDGSPAQGRHEHAPRPSALPGSAPDHLKPPDAQQEQRTSRAEIDVLA